MLLSACRSLWIRPRYATHVRHDLASPDLHHLRSQIDSVRVLRHVAIVRRGRCAGWRWCRCWWEWWWGKIRKSSSAAGAAASPFTLEPRRQGVSNGTAEVRNSSGRDARAVWLRATPQVTPLLKLKLDRLQGEEWVYAHRLPRLPLLLPLARPPASLRPPRLTTAAVWMMCHAIVGPVSLRASGRVFLTKGVELGPTEERADANGEGSRREEEMRACSRLELAIAVLPW